MKLLASMALLAAFGLLITTGGRLAQRAAADIPADYRPGLQFSLDIKELTDCTTRVRDPTCTLAPDSTFTLEVKLDALGQGVPQYEGYDIFLRYAGVTPNQDASMDDWPDCGFPASAYDRPGIIGMGCAIGVPPAGPSSYTGVIATNTFKCTQSGTITLEHGSGETDLVQTISSIHAEIDTEETINVLCATVPTGQPGVVATATEGGPRNDTPPPRPSEQPTAVETPGPTLEPTAAAQATATAAAQQTAQALTGGPAGGTPTAVPANTGGGGGGNTGIWIAVGIIGAAAVVVAAAGGWWKSRGRGAGGGTPPARGGSAST